MRGQLCWRYLATKRRQGELHHPPIENSSLSTIVAYNGWPLALFDDGNSSKPFWTTAISWILSSQTWLLILGWDWELSLSTTSCITYQPAVTFWHLHSLTNAMAHGSTRLLYINRSILRFDTNRYLKGEIKFFLWFCLKGWSMPFIPHIMLVSIYFPGLHPLLLPTINCLAPRANTAIK